MLRENREKRGNTILQEQLCELPVIEEEMHQASPLPMQGGGALARSEEAVESECSGSRGRTRGKRNAKHGDQQGQRRVIWLHNSSGRPQLMAAVRQARDEGRKMPIALLNQEHHCGPAEWPDLQAMVSREGLKCMGAHAVVKGARERTAS